MLLADLVTVTGVAKAADARTEKVGHLGSFLRDLSPTEAALCVELLLRTDLFGENPDTEVSTEPIAPHEHPSLSCEHVAHAFSEADRAPAAAIRRSLRDQLLARATREEQHWILAAIDHRHLDRQTFDLIVTSAAGVARVPVGSVRRAATLCGSLPLAVRIAFDRGESGLESVSFEPGRPIPPTVAESVTSLASLLTADDRSIVEWNVVADRIQVHRVRNEVRVYDGQLIDVTDLVPVVVDQVAAFPRDDLVLDGFVDIDRRSGPDSSAVQGWTRRSGARRLRERATFFDVLFDGAPVVDVPLSERRALLAAIVPEAERLPVLDIGDVDDLALAMNEGLRLGHGGLVVKPSDTPYDGGLTKSTWRLVEPTPVVRLAVVAARRGSGGRSHLLSTIHLAARDDRDQLVQVGRTARGLTEEMIVRQTGWFARLMLDEPETESGRVFQLRPEIVAVVAIDGVEFEAESGELALRHPSVLDYSQRKELELTTLDELRTLLVGDEAESPPAAIPDADHTGGDNPPLLPRLPARVGPATPAPTPSDQKPTPRPVTDLDSVRPRAQRTAGGRRASTEMDFEPYVEPVLTSARPTRLSVTWARVATLAWVLALLAVALRERSAGGRFDPGAVTQLGRIGGVVVVVTLAASGWLWSDHLVRTLIKLDGRIPTRLRCVTAWWSPVLTVLALALAVVPLEPTEPADVRPAIIAVTFGWVMWRPYALVRRILFTLTRLRSDSLIAFAYILDVLSFGFLWWRLSVLGDNASGGEVDILIGALGATVISAALSVLVWRGLLRAADEAVSHRRSSQRTRYEHRMLRLRGVDPTDPEVWWELVHRRAAEERETADEENEARAGLPTVDDLIENTRREHTVAFRRLGSDGSTELENRLRAEFSAILGDATAPDDMVSQTDVVSAELTDDSPGEQRVEPSTPAAAGTERSDVLQEPGPEREDPIDVIRRRARQLEEKQREPNDIEQLISRAGSLQIDAALAEQRRRERSAAPGERTVPPRLVAIEAARLVTVATFAALSLATAWLVVTSMSSDATADTGRLSAAVIDDLELGRKIFWALFSIGGALVAMWSMAMLRRATAAGVGNLRLRRVRVLWAASASACAAGFVFDGAERGTVTLLLTTLIIWSAVSAGFCVEPVRAWFGLPSATLTACIATLPVILGIAWLAGLVGPLDPSISLQRFAFTTILLALACARVAVMFVLTSVDLEDALRTSPRLATPDSESVRS